MAAPNDEGPAVRTQTPRDQTKTDTAIVGEFIDKRNEDARQTEASAFTLQLIRDIATGNESRFITRNETNQAKGGRPRKHADAAARQAAYRARNAGMLVDLRIDKHTAEKINEFALSADISFTELANQMLKFALSNRDWKQNPMFGKPLPNAQRKPMRKADK